MPISSKTKAITFAANLSLVAAAERTAALLGQTDWRFVSPLCSTGSFFSAAAYSAIKNSTTQVTKQDETIRTLEASMAQLSQVIQERDSRIADLEKQPTLLQQKVADTQTLESSPHTLFGSSDSPTKTEQPHRSDSPSSAPAAIH